MAIETLAARAGATPLRIRRVQKITLTPPFIAGIVNFLDRSSLSVAGEAIRADLGLSATEFGVLLSAFSLSYGFAQLPSGILLDRVGPRIVLGAGLIFWSAMQALTGMVNSFSHFILLRIGLGIGEAPFMPAGVKSINDWYAQRSAVRRWGYLTPQRCWAGHCATGSGYYATGLGLANNVCGDWLSRYRGRSVLVCGLPKSPALHPAGRGAAVSGQRGGGPPGAEI